MSKFNTEARIKTMDSLLRFHSMPGGFVARFVLSCAQCRDQLDVPMMVATGDNTQGFRLFDVSTCGRCGYTGIEVGTFEQSWADGDRIGRESWKAL